MEKRFEYRGDLAITPLAEVLATINRYRVPGVLTLAREGRLRKIQLDNGIIAFASSNERELSLGMHLLKTGILKPDAAREAEARRTQDGLRLGQVLLQMGILTPESLNQAVLVQVREILWSSFDWEVGEVAFDIGPREGRELVRIDLPIPEAILAGIRRTADVRRMVARLGSSQTTFERTQSTHLCSRSGTELPRDRRPYAASKLCTPREACRKTRILYALSRLGRARATSPGAKRFSTRRRKPGGWLPAVSYQFFSSELPEATS
jgi:hypothetical protein